MDWDHFWRSTGKRSLLIMPDEQLEMLTLSGCLLKDTIQP